MKITTANLLTPVIVLKIHHRMHKTTTILLKTLLHTKRM